MSTYKLPCGCKYDERAWLWECPAHKAESDGIHEAARAGVSYFPVVTPAEDDWLK